MQQHEKLIDLITNFSNAMFVTRAPNGELDARPMAIAQVEEGGTIWFITNRNSGKVAELMLDHDVAVTMQSSKEFVALSGRCHAVDDPGKVDELWSEKFKVWFPEGKHDSSLLLLRVDPTEGEYWDSSGMNGIKYLFEAGKALVRGETPDTSQQINASMKLR